MRSVQVQFAIDDIDRGDAIAAELLNRHLVACVQTIGPVTSRYWWRGSINQAEERLYLCKTAPDRVADVIECIRSLHPYDVPETVWCDSTAGLEAYVDWIVAETRRPGSDGNP